MNKGLSLAIEEAIRNYPSKQEGLDIEKRRALFSLTQETELFQNEKVLCLYIFWSESSRYCTTEIFAGL